MIGGEALLSLELTVDYAGKPRALDQLRLEVGRGEIVGLVGQSGCGKSTLALAILRLLHLKGGRARGTVMLDGRDLMLLREREMRRLRGKEIGLVLQSPLASLNPALRIGTQLEEAWRIHQRGTKEEMGKAIAEGMGHVSLPAEEEFLRRYPGQLSVGQAQRVLIAMAVLHRPALLIADEPTSALDVITQSDILQLFGTLSRKLNISILYISHDLLSVATISHRVAVMERGAIVEQRETAEIFRNPQHEYTRRLIGALPVIPQFRSAQAGA